MDWVNGPVFVILIWLSWTLPFISVNFLEMKKTCYSEQEIIDTTPGNEVIFHLTLSISFSSGAWIICCRMMKIQENTEWSWKQFVREGWSFMALEMLNVYACSLEITTCNETFLKPYSMWDTEAHSGGAHTNTWLLTQCGPSQGAVANSTWRILLGPTSVPPSLSYNPP